MPELVDLDLASPAGAGLLERLRAGAGESLARAARLPRRLFLLRSPWAPGLHFVGGQVDVAAVVPSMPHTMPLAGSGETIDEALVSCLAEGIERLSQFERPGDGALAAPLAAVAGRLLPGSQTVLTRAARDAKLARDAPIAWLAGQRLGGEEEALVPADFCLRRAAPGGLADPAAALSTGTAAGASFAAAAGRALLERVERDAAALWWVGGRRGRPLALEHEATAARALVQLRQGSTQRTTWLLDIATDLAIPVVAALSVDPDGRGLACGLAARLSAAAAARAALVELCQMELALVLARAKVAAGIAPTPIDRRHLARGQRIDAARCALLHPVGAPRAATSEPADDAAATLAALGACFARHGVAAALVDLTRSEHGVAVVHAFAPALQAMPGARRTDRLRRAIAQTGGTKRWIGNVALM
jgi:ribosomal protein S12 methylthiotransferase accessory factor